MSEFLYHQDPYRKNAETIVDGSFEDEGRYLLALKTCLFYPQGGGQKGDRGRLQINGTDIAVVDTIKDSYSENGRPLLILDKPYDVVAPGAAMIAEINWDHRYRQMRLHGTVHMHHCMMEKVLGRKLSNPATSDLLDDGTAYNRYDIPDVTEDLVRTANAELEAAIAKGAQVTTTDDPQKVGFRWWHCLGYSIPCGGTHVKDIAEIGKLSISYSQRKGKPKVTFALMS